jgi:hypothetical protein
VNTKKPPIDLVLGPDGAAAAVRLQSLLGLVGLTAPDAQVWAEDYLSAFGGGNGWMPNYAPSDEDDEGDDV